MENLQNPQTPEIISQIETKQISATTSTPGYVLTVDNNKTAQWLETKEAKGTIPSTIGVTPGYVLTVGNNNIMQWSEVKGTLPSTVGVTPGYVLTVGNNGTMQWSEMKGAAPLASGSFNLATPAGWTSVSTNTFNYYIYNDYIMIDFTNYEIKCNFDTNSYILTYNTLLPQNIRPTKDTSFCVAWDANFEPGSFSGISTIVFKPNGNIIIITDSFIPTLGTSFNSGSIYKIIRSSVFYKI